MVDVAVVKQKRSPTLTSSATELATALGLRRRRARLSALGFALAFAIFTAFLALRVSPENSPFLSGLLFASNSSSSSTIGGGSGGGTGTGPYGYQLSSIFFRFFQNSSSSPLTSWGSAATVAGNREISGDNATTESLSGSGVSTSEKSDISEKNATFGSAGRNGVTASEDSWISGKNASSASLRGTAVTKDQKNQMAAGRVVASLPKGNVSEAVAANRGGALNNNAQDISKVNLQRKNRTAAVAGVVMVPLVKGNVSESVAADRSGALNNNAQDISKVYLQRKNRTAAAAGVAMTPPVKGNISEAVAANRSGELNNNAQDISKVNLQRKNRTAAAGVAMAPPVKGNVSLVSTTSESGPQNTKTQNLQRNNHSLISGNSSSSSSSSSWIHSLMNCDIFHGNWVKDDSYPLYPEGSCPHIDEPFNCYLNGRLDHGYQKLRWQPSRCKIPRFNATDMLERLRGKRLVFVGDSLNRNMWESLICILRNSLKDKSKVFEASGRQEFKTEGSYSFLFEDYNCSVEFFRSPFLVQEWEMPSGNGTKKETLRLDIIEQHSSKYKDAHIIVFNTGHWWTHEKTAKGKDYYQEGEHVYGELNVVDAFHKALNTWAKWVDYNVNPKKSLVFFRGYSASHFSGGQWNSGGACDKESEPIKNDTYLSTYPPKMRVLETVMKGMKVPVSYLNITRMTDYRKDAHPSVYRKQNLTEEERRSPERFQDCSHWCLPGVPDSWNELLYAQLIVKQEKMK